MSVAGESETPVAPGLRASVDDVPARVSDRQRWATVAALGAVVLGLAVRVWYLTTPGSATMDSDQITTALMVRNIMSGSDFYVFFAGQDYNGALDQYVQALFYLVLPVPENGFTLRLVSALFAGVAIWLVYLVGVRVLDGRWRAVFAAILFAGGPFFLIQKGTNSDGGYASTQVLAIFGLYCALRLRGRSSDSWVWAGLLGLASGLCVWTGLTGAFLILPACLWAAATVIRSRRAALAALAGIVVGAAPVIMWMVRYRLIPSPGGDTQPTSTLLGRIGNVFGTLTREFLGVGLEDGRPGWPIPLQVLAVIAAAGAWCVAAVLRRHGLLDLITARTGHRRPVDVLLIAVPFTWIVCAVSSFGWYSGTPRYLFVAFPLLAWLLAALVPRRAKAGLPVAVLIGAIYIGTSVWQVVQASGHIVRPTAGDYAAAGAALTAAGDVDVYGSYWEVLPLRYYGGDAINPAPLSVGDRFAELRAPVDRSDDFVFIAGAGDLKAPNGIAATLRSHAITFTTSRFGSLVVYSDLSAHPRPWDIGIGQRPGTLPN